MEAPTGSVALVFTDIQGSTRLWEALGGDFEALLALHDAIMRECISKYGGYEVKTEGDAFMVSFRSAGDGLAFCLRAQEELHRAAWPDWAMARRDVGSDLGESADGAFRGVRVRMGLHWGQPRCRVDSVTGRMDYLGSPVNRAARVSGAGHGGQVLVSESALAAAGGAAALDGCRVIDLGEHVLRGLEGKERLFQVDPAQMVARSFPRLRTPDVRKTNLPARTSSFVGRETELEELSQLMDSGVRLLTLLGPGGTGKTRLSQRYAALALHRYAGGVWFCDLTQARGLDGILGGVGTALDLPLGGPQPARRLGDAILGRGRALFVLDNFEQVVEWAPETVGAWMRRAPEAVFLVTSRRPLSLEGERLLPIDPLGLPGEGQDPEESEAAQLFLERARAARPGLVLDEEAMEDLRVVLRDLDGLPLALELAAARMRVLSVKQIRERLAERFRLLAGSRRDHSDRQATLRGAIDWSWDLLTDWEKSALVQCSQFRGGFRLEDAEAVLDLSQWPDAPWAMDVVESLVDHSLLRLVEENETGSRLDMLLSIRDYAAEKLDTTDAVALRHAQRFAALGAEEALQKLKGPEGLAARANLAREVENLIRGAESALSLQVQEAAVNCTAAVLCHLDRHGPMATGLRLVDRVLGLKGLEDPHALRLYYLRSWVRRSAGDLPGAEEDLRQALKLSRRLQDRRQEAQVLGLLGSFVDRQGRSQEAAELLESALALARELGEQRMEGLATGDLAAVRLHLGNVEEALGLFESAIAIHRATGNREFEGIHLGTMAVCLHQAARFAEAQDCYEQALALHREQNNPRFVGIELTNLATLHREQGSLVEARALYAEALELHREMGNRRFMGLVEGNLGALELEEGDPGSALSQLNSAVAVFSETGDAQPMALFLVYRAQALLELGESEGAHKDLDKAGKIAEALGTPPEGELSLRIAEVFEKLGP